MNIDMHIFCLKVDAEVVTEAALNYRPTTWPPSADWPVVINHDGVVVSRWGDSVWDLTPWSGKPMSLNSGDGKRKKSEPIDIENANILRLSIGWLIWGPRGCKTPGTISNRFVQIKAVILLCSRNKINAASLMRFPKVVELLPEVIAPSKWDETITVFHRLYDAKEHLGFSILDANGLKRLSEIADEHVTVQTPYIPPRIWVYQLGRLRECIDDFLLHKTQVEECFQFCIDAYSANYGSLPDSLKANKDENIAPFCTGAKKLKRCKYIGTFFDTAKRFGIADLLAKWITGDRTAPRISAFSSYLNLVTRVGLAYIANFTLQRKEEVAALRTSCLIWEHDEKLGRVPIICGETTKTDSDADARWVASPSVAFAVSALTAIASLRMICDAECPSVGATDNDRVDPYLFSVSSEPWGYSGRRPYRVRHPIKGLNDSIRSFPMLFDVAQMRITSEDLKIARRLTPNLSDDAFAVGKVWPLAWHQYRRTGAVNMFASRTISDSSMQQQMKHSTRLMPLYYGRGHTRLHLNGDVEKLVVKAMYEAIALRLKEVVSDRFISPHSPERKEALAVNVLSAKDVKTLAALVKTGKVSFREHRLGGCMKPGPCDYGGIESVARCGGGDGGKPCVDVLYDRDKASQVLTQLDVVTLQMEQLSAGHPRLAALRTERQAMENFLNAFS